MARIKKVTRNKHEGKIIYGDGIVDGIVYLAVAEIPYAELYTLKQRAKNRSKSIKVNFAKDGVHVEVVVKVHYSQAVSDMAFKIQEIIRHNVEAMTDYHIANVNVVVCGVLFDEKVVVDNSINNETVLDKTEEDKTQAQDK